MRRKKSTAEEIARRVRHGTPPQPAPGSSFTIRVLPGHSIGPIDPKKVEKVGVMENGKFIPRAELAEPASPRRLWPKLLAWFCFAILLGIFVRWVTS